MSVNNNRKYDDIISMPHHVSKRRPKMSAEMRAAQFAPFAALTGHDSAVRQSALEVEEMNEKGGRAAEGEFPFEPC